MLGLRTTAVVGTLLLGAILLAEMAFSQTMAATNAKEGLDLTPIVIAVINLAFPVVAAVATYLINDKVKNHQLALQLSNAVQNGVGVIQQRTTTAVRGSTDLTVAVGNPDIQAGVQYVINMPQKQ